MTAETRPVTDPAAEYPFHRYAEWFPLLQGEEFEVLVEDIRENDLKVEIVLYRENGVLWVLDGRNRYRACPLAGRERRYVEYVGDDPFGFSVRVNMLRRHMSNGARALFAARIEETTWGGARGQDATLRVDRKRAARMCLVSERLVCDARVVLDHGTPEIRARVESGELAMNNAVEICRTLTPEKQSKIADQDQRGWVEVLGLGQQLAAFGVHPETGRPYEWRPHPPVRRADLPVLGEAVARHVNLGAVVWRLASGRRSIPCPAWLSWMVELDNPFTKTNRAATIVERLDLQPGMAVLDVGCGPGRLTIPIATKVGVFNWPAVTPSIAAITAFSGTRMERSTIHVKPKPSTIAMATMM